mgnify:CR=1 FL=1
MDLIPAETGAEGLNANEIKMTKNAMALANIQTSVVGQGQMGDDFLKLSGKIKTNEESNAVQVTYFGGRIEKLYVNSTGERVAEGQRLATIYSPELVAAQQELLTTLSLKESQPQLYKAVRNKLKLWKLSEKQINTIETVGKVQENFPVFATVSGTVTHKMVEEGDYVKQGQPLYKIANFKTVWAEFDAYEKQISLLKEGQSIKVTTNAYQNEVFDAKISFIDPLLNSATRTIIVRAVLNNKKDKFKPGMFVEGKVEGVQSSSKNTVTVPATAVMWTGKRSLVYIKTKPNESVFEMREVLLGSTTGDNYTILEGLKNGDEVVTNGTFTVDAAAQLAAKKIGQNLTKIDMKLLSGEKAHNHWMTIQKELKTSANDIENSSEIAIQRGHFKHLSAHMISSVQLFGINQEVYSEFCPMADNNKGAFWLSLEKEIRNPYYGEAMLKCGEVKATLK